MIFLVLSCFSGIMIFFLSLLCFLSCFLLFRWSGGKAIECFDHNSWGLGSDSWNGDIQPACLSGWIWRRQSLSCLFYTWMVNFFLATCVHFFQLDVPQSLWLILNFSEGAVVSCLNFRLLLTYNNKFFGFSLSAGTSAISAMNLIMWIF